MTELQVRKDNLSETRLVEGPEGDAECAPGANQILVRIERFAFTANNVTYGVAGDQLGYWQFFPPSGDDTKGWGIIPVWGFATVVTSNVDEIKVGERLYGYFPPASTLKMMPVGIAAERFFDGAAHRAKLPSGYNNYRRVNAEPGYNRDFDNERMLLFPLHVTSYCLWDLLSENHWYGAKQVIIMSASSKTSIGLACGLHSDSTAPTVIAMTSERNREFVNGLGLYDQTLSYDEVANIDATIPTVIVDMSGNGTVLGKLHSHLQDNMVRCINVGLTHWDELGKGEGLIKERSKFFFAPSHIEQRMKDWGPEGFMKKSFAFLQKTAAHSRKWLKIQRVDGLSGLADIFDDVVQGRIAPDAGLIVELEKS